MDRGEPPPLFPYVQFLYHLRTLSVPYNSLFPNTWGSSLGLATGGTLIFVRRYGLDSFRSLVYAVGLSFVATILFELTFQNILFLHGGAPN
jgi:hypothetical protein